MDTASRETALRPMSAGLVLDRTFQIYRGHFVMLAGIGVLLPTLLFLLRLAFVPLGYPPRGAAARDPWAVLTVFSEYMACWCLIYMIGHALTGAATVYAVSKLHLGETVTIAESYRKTLPRFWSVLRIAWNIYLRFAAVGVVTYFACVMVVVGWASLPANAIGGATRGLLVTLAAILGISVGLAGVFWMLYLYAKYCLAVPASVMENLTGRPALKRSRFLAKGSLRKIILIYGLMLVLGFVLAMVFWLPGQLYVSLLRGRSYMVAMLLRSLGSFFAGVLTGPISTIAVSLMYYDQRVRKEAFDLQWMMESMGQPGPPSPPEASLTHAQP